jgi:hypothetical protein
MVEREGGLNRFESKMLRLAKMIFEQEDGDTSTAVLILCELANDWASKSKASIDIIRQPEPEHTGVFGAVRKHRPTGTHVCLWARTHVLFRYQNTRPSQLSIKGLSNSRHGDRAEAAGGSSHGSAAPSVTKPDVRDKCLALPR